MARRFQCPALPTSRQNLVGSGCLKTHNHPSVNRLPWKRGVTRRPTILASLVYYIELADCARCRLALHHREWSGRIANRPWAAIKTASNLGVHEVIHTQVRIQIQAAMIGFCLLQVVAGDDGVNKDKRFVAFDIQPHTNKKLSEDFHTLPGNNLKLLPRGRQQMADVDFFIGEKFIQLAGKRAPDYPERIEGIAINRPVTKLHFLHGAGWVVSEGTVVGDYVIHYDDKTTISLPIEYGRDVKDWWLYDFDKKELTRAVLAWRGLNHASKNFQGTQINIGLFRRTWENPHPEKKVVAVDYVSRNETVCSPFLVALTGESLAEAGDLFEYAEASPKKEVIRDPQSKKASSTVSIEEEETIDELRRIKALVEFDDDGRLISVAISGPGLRQDVVRGSNQTVILLSSLQSIEKLDLSNSSITDDGLEPLEKLKNLRVLSLSLTSITNSGLEHLEKLKTLERLRLHGTKITDEGIEVLAGLTKLKVLDLSKTQISDAGIVQLKSLESLEELDLRNTTVTTSAVTELKGALPKIRILR